MLLNLSGVQVEEGWWNGLLNGKSGLFPSNFVKEMDVAGEEVESNESAAEETGKKAHIHSSIHSEGCSSGWKNIRVGELEFWDWVRQLGGMIAERR